MKSKLISIIIPIYNVEEYLTKCLDSVVNQTYKNIEIICVIDGSPDNSIDICRQFAKNDERVIIVEQKNQGASVARNTGIEKARGDYIIFLDSDDYWASKNVLYQLCKRIEKTNPDVLSFNFCKESASVRSGTYFNVETMPYVFSPAQSIEYISNHDLWISSAWNKIIKAELFDENELLFKEGVIAEDILWCANLALVANKFDYIDLEVVVYGKNDFSVSRTMNYNKICMLENNILETYQLFSNRNCKGTIIKLLNQYMSYQISTLLFNIATIRDSKKRKELTKQITPLLYLLNYSHIFKTRLINVTYKIFGMKMLLIFLNVFWKMSK